MSMLLLMVEQAGQERDVSTERFRTLFKHTDDIIYFYGLDGQIIDANQAAIDKYGYSKEELLRMSNYELQGDDDRKLIQEQMTAANQKGIDLETIHHEKALTEISCCAGSQFDPDLVKIFLRIFTD